MRSVFRTAVALIALALAASSCGSSGTATDNTEVASIGDRVLTRSGLDDLLPTGDATVPQRRADIVSTWLLTQAIEFELVERGYEITDDDRAAAQEAIDASYDPSSSRVTNLEALSQAFALSIAVGRWADDESDDVEFELPGYLCSSHLVVETEEEATAALERLSSGEAFADLAIELSTGPSGQAGGDLGCAIEGTYVPAFDEAAYATEPGDVAGPVETEFGWHLIEVHSVGPAAVEFHPQADRQELDTISFEARQGQIQALVFTFETDARANFGDLVSVDPSIGTIDLTTFAITPA